MSHFAKVENGIVTQVIVAEQNVIDSSLFGSGWVQTSYNGTFRKNYAGIGDTYDADRDAFIPPKPYASWVLDENTCSWVAPTACPDDNSFYIWNETTVSWDKQE